LVGFLAGRVTTGNRMSNMDRKEFYKRLFVFVVFFVVFGVVLVWLRSS